MKVDGSKLAVICLIGFSLNSLSSSLLAQPDPRRAIPDSSQIAQTMDYLAKRLLLTDSLKTKVSQIYHASFKELRQELARNTGNSRAEQKVTRQIMQIRDQQVKDLLNDRQKKGYDKFLQEQRAQFRKQMKARQEKVRR